MTSSTHTQVSAQPFVTVTPGDSTPTELIEFGSDGPSSEPTNGNDRVDEANVVQPMSLFRKVVVVVQLSGVNFASSAVNGLVVVGLPTIAADVNLPEALTFWPTSVSSLSTASTLLLAGSLADSVGPRAVNLAGCVVSGAFIVGGGVAKTGPQLVVMRALQGVGYAMHLASSVAIVTHTLSRGRPRNFAFSCLGLSQPLGFSFGLVLGGVLQDLLGWRAAWYMYGGLTLGLSAVATWALPKSRYKRTVQGTLHNLRDKIDWVGALLASTFMALLSYLFA
ncbi:hypothetical protein E4U43_003853 [Claviceps pusilla]|uniref:Major facilitator superfamily (MFS) profile domain-containing protein n=1 Tax=Claviceps pusilla TaxID=123648 RepID=A0A9P7SUB1_9HYPO|nr:hypothetical protein E4U43_003853 [Claviceps pusilla]